MATFFGPVGRYPDSCKGMEAWSTWSVSENTHLVKLEVIIVQISDVLVQWGQEGQNNDKEPTS